MNKILLCFLILLPNLFLAQFTEQVGIAWPDKFTDYKELPDSLKKNDAVILNENISITKTEITVRTAIKILNENGLAHFKNLQLPQNFDLTNSPNFNKQGRFKDRINPFLEFTVDYFIARIIKPNKKIIELPIKYKANKTYWIQHNGERLYEKVYDFTFDNLQVGDILEYIYKEAVTVNDLQDVIYPNNKYPKLNYNLKIIATSLYYSKQQRNLPLIYNTNIDTANFSSTDIVASNQRVVTNIYHYNYLSGIEYPQNLQVGTLLPNISVNNNFYIKNDYYSRFDRMNPSSKRDMESERSAFRSNYTWMFFLDTIHTNYYDNYNLKIIKFISTIEEDKTDTFNVIFLSRLTNALNSLKFISAETMNYSSEAQYAVASSERLMLGQIVEEFIFKDYSSILTAKNVFYYETFIIDKRLSTVNSKFRNHSSLEKTIITLPTKNEFKFFVPRYKGLKYFADELPFYYEGTSCVLLPCYSCTGNNKSYKTLFGHTPISTASENLRTEAAVFNVNVDSSIISATIKEHLGGQFSTVLRSFYNKEIIDSTIPEYYFKRCMDVPLAFNKQIKQVASEEVFPFTQKYHCAEKIMMESKTKIDLHNWFAFTYKKEDYPTIPNHAFYTDFVYTDNYDFLFQFNKPVEITNIENLNKKVENNYFEATSSFTKQEDSTYLLNVRIKVKQPVVPQKEGDKLTEFVNVLNEINNFVIEFKK
ncbi:MAG: hypothetical protein ABI388_07340 [Bacteroidia bacterium]